MQEVEGVDFYIRPLYTYSPWWTPSLNNPFALLMMSWDAKKGKACRSGHGMEIPIDLIFCTYYAKEIVHLVVANEGMAILGGPGGGGSKVSIIC